MTETPKVPETKFKPSWLVGTEEEFKKLREGQLGTVGKKMAMFQETGIADTLNASQLADRAARWGEEAVEEGNEVWPELTPFFTRITARIKAMSQVTTTPSAEPENKILEDIRETLKEGGRIQKAQLQFQEKELELMRKGYKGFIQGIVKRLHVNPEQYDQALPPWFEELDPKTQQMLTNLLHINYLAAIKRDTGMVTLDNWTNTGGLRIEDEALDEMQRNMPGFRIALATFVNDIFEAGRDVDHLVISGSPKEGKNAATGGYAFVGSEKDLNKYKEKVAANLENYFLSVGKKFYEAHKSDIEKIIKANRGDLLENYFMQHATADERAFFEAKKFRVEVRDLAEVAVAAVDNLFFAGGAYDSGDEQRMITPGDANVYSEQIRAFFMPGIKGEAKWLLTKTSTEIAERKEKEGVGEEDFGGILGAWILENAAINRDGFRDKLQLNTVRLIPDRLYYSLFDHEYFAKDTGNQYAKKSIAQALIWSTKVAVPNATGLWDFRDGENEIPWLDLPYELLGDYADGRSAAIKIFKHLTSGKPEDILDNNGLVNAFIKARKDPLANKIFRDEDLLVSCFAMRASPPGLTRGISEMVLMVPENLYDLQVYNITLDDRFYDGMPDGTRERILRRLHARDLKDTGLRNFLTRLGSGGVIDERRRLREKATKNLTRKRKR